jgi:hypothetical protein
MHSSLLIPKKCKVGFNPRPDTYTGKLGYVIAHDGKKWRKEDSWNGWIYHVKQDEYISVEKLRQYNQRREQLTQNYNRCLSATDKWSIESIKDLTLDQYIDKYAGSFDRFQPNIGRVTNDTSFEPFEFDNVPTEGFVLNKKAGGYSNGWNHRATYCRVYDPRGFEFEIQIPNLLYILQECNAYKGKGLEGQFVYSWDGKDLVLLPVSSPEYVQSTAFTKLQDEKVSSKELIVGATYMSKHKENYVYLGRFDWVNHNWDKTISIDKNAYIMYNLRTSKVEHMNGLASIAKLVNADMHQDYATLLSKFSDSENAYNVEDFEETRISVGQLPWRAKSNKSFGTSLIKVDEGEYDIYDMILLEKEYDRSYNYIAKRFDLVNKKKLFINSDKTITIKPAKEQKVINNLTPRDFKGHTLLGLNAKLKNNKIHKVNI